MTYDYESFCRIYAEEYGLAISELEADKIARPVLNLLQSIFTT